MTERVVKTAEPRKGDEAAPPGLPSGGPAHPPLPHPPPRPMVRANLGVRLVVRERVRKDPDRPVHMADVKIPGPG